jgi:hypothetical protein
MRRPREGVVVGDRIVAELRHRLAARSGVDLGGRRGNPLGERRVGLYEISQPTALLLDMATLRIGDLSDMPSRTWERDGLRSRAGGRSPLVRSGRALDRYSGARI